MWAFFEKSPLETYKNFLLETYSTCASEITYKHLNINLKMKNIWLVHNFYRNIQQEYVSIRLSLAKSPCHRPFSSIAYKMTKMSLF